MRYDPEIYPLLFESLMQNGLTVKDACEKIGISDRVVLVWKKRYPEFKAALKRGKAPVDNNVVSALYKNAIGYGFEEVVTEPKKLTVEEIEERSKMENPPPIPLIKKKVTTKYIPPNVIAQIFWLKNRLPEQWRDRSEAKITGKIEYTIKLPPRPNEDIKVGEKKVDGVITNPTMKKLYDPTRQISREIETEILGQELINEANEIKKASKNVEVNTPKKL